MAEHSTTPLIVHNCTVVPMTGRDVILDPGFVRIDGGRIAEVGTGPKVAADEGAELLDGGGKVLMPGLINAHTHLYQVLLRAVWEDLPLLPWLQRIYATAQVLLPEHVHAGTMLGCVESLKGGVTTVCEHNFLNPAPECATEALRAMTVSGLRGVFARTIMDSGEIVPDCTRESADEALRRIEGLIEHRERVFTANEQQRVTLRTGPNTPPINTSDDLLREIRRFADAHTMGLSAHVAESCSVVELVKSEHSREGVVDYLKDFGLLGEDSVFAHCVHLTSEEIRHLAQTKTSVSHNPVSNMMLGDGIAPVVEMLAQGVNVALGTDGAASNHSQDLFETMKTASLLQKVKHQNAGIIDPYTVLRMATAGGAQALGLGEVCGSIEVGKRADLILVDIEKPHILPINDLVSQLVHCAKATDVDTVIVAGRVLMKARTLLSVDEGRILDSARRARDELMQRLDTLSL